jgi:hypothetical protein
MKTTRITLVAAAAVLIGSSVLVAVPATAAPAACQPGQGCTYEDVNYGQGHINFNQNVRSYAAVGWWVPTNHPLTNDAASSAFNNGSTGRWTRVFLDEGYKGRYIQNAMGTGTPNLNVNDLSDKVSSACFDGYCK